MKKLVLVVISLLVSGSIMAAHGPAGCGLGAVLFKDQKGLVFHVLAATFNGSSGNQTFAMSTGTLGCETAQTAKVSAISFIDNNLVALSNDISKGEGQTLDAYLSLINANSVNKNVLKNNYATIFANNNAQDIHNKINDLVNL